jgi:hypothetical protein
MNIEPQVGRSGRVCRILISMERVFWTALWDVRRGGIGARALAVVGLALLANTACSSSESRPDASGAPDGGLFIYLDTIPAPDATGKVAIDTQPLPPCCTEAVTLSPMVGAAPCSFALPDPPPPYLDDVGVYLNKNLVEGHSTDGWAYDSTKTSIVFLGTSCETIMSGSQAEVVQLVCSCVPRCQVCF